MRVIADLCDLVLPRVCAGCREPGASLCMACRAQLAAARPFTASPDPRPGGLPRTRAAVPYDRPARGLLIAHKERGALALVRPLGVLLAAAVDDLRPGPVVLVPVPSSPAATRARGHDHALRLARAAATQLGTGAAPLLRTARSVADQGGLDATARAANLHGALVARASAAGLPVVVVDDVMTTGATLVEAARALRDAGALVRGAAVVAAVGRRHLAAGAG